MSGVIFGTNSRWGSFMMVINPNIIGDASEITTNATTVSFGQSRAPRSWILWMVCTCLYIISGAFIHFDYSETHI